MDSTFIYSWGFSKYGQTGLDNCQYTDEPNKLFVPIIKELSSISTGEFNTAFIFQDNNAFIYGLNTFGQLGNGNSKNNSKKISIIPLKLKIKFEKLSLGGGHVLGLSKDNHLYSWGLNIFGQLGLGNNNNIGEPTLVEKIGIFENMNIKENKFPEDLTIIDIKAAPQHSLILLSDNNIYSCGFAKFGALGYYLNGEENEPNDNNIFTKIDLEQFNNEEKITNISAGFAHSGCVINNIDFLIWGKNKNFEFEGIQKYNLNEILSRSNNESISNDKEFFIKDFQIGKDFAVILTTNGYILTEGDNSMGQLGKNEEREFFEIVNLPEHIKEISVGYDFVYAIGESGKIFAWGSNKYGQIPEFDKNICYEPFNVTRVNDLKPVFISCGGYHVSVICENEITINDKKKYFKNLPLNKCFNKDNFKKRKIFYDRISENLEIQQQLSDALDEKEKEYQKIYKEYEKKEKLKRLKDGNIENNEKEKEKIDLDVEIEKILDEEVRLEELEFPEDCLIGSGAFGDVKKAYWRKTLVSVKFLKTNFEEKENQIISFVEEYNLLKQLRHPNILLYIGGNITGPQHFLITEYCENGNLFEFLHGKDSPELEDIERLNLALEIAQGINYLHSFNPPILHRDLKSLNILLDKNYVVKIADFGWAKLLNNHMTKMRGTFQWMAPEVISKENYTEKADVYSFGIILWEFWSKEPPYHGIPAKEVGTKVKNDKNYRPKIPEDVPREIAELMEVCWEEDPDKRPTFLEIINFLDEYLKEL